MARATSIISRKWPALGVCGGESNGSYANARLSRSFKVTFQSTMFRGKS
jgi:hypothetical protein